MKKQEVQKMMKGKRLSFRQATNVAESQTDLGGNSQRDMVSALFEWDAGRAAESYLKLDSLSQLIVRGCLADPDLIGSRIDDLKYEQEQLIKALRAYDPEIN